MKILTSDNTEIITKLCQICLKNELYMEGRLAKDWMQLPQNIRKMSTVFQNKKALGWSMLYSSEDPWHCDLPVLAVFVLPSFRQRGVGKSLVEAVMKNFNEEVFLDSRISFFKKTPPLKGLELR